MKKWFCAKCARAYVEKRNGFSVLRCSINLDQNRADEEKHCDCFINKSKDKRV